MACGLVLAYVAPKNNKRNVCTCTEGPVFNKRTDMDRLKVTIGDLELKNPVTTASGTFGYGSEYADFIDLNRLIGIFVKGTTLEPRERLSTYGRNSIGNAKRSRITKQGRGLLCDTYLPYNKALRYAYYR